MLRRFQCYIFVLVVLTGVCFLGTLFVARFLELTEFGFVSEVLALTTLKLTSVSA